MKLHEDFLEKIALCALIPFYYMSLFILPAPSEKPSLPKECAAINLGESQLPTVKSR